MFHRHQLILGTAGHIDHGKTALVRTLTGVDTDRLPQEKQRGITIDLGFAELDLGEYDLGVVDVPGHERFIRNMLAGAAGVDLAMLIIAADDSVMPQTREHLAILQLLNIKHGLIALTKTDLVDPDWTDLVEQDVRQLVQNTFLQDAPIVRTSATTGAGIEALKTTLRSLCASTAREPTGELFRLAVDRSFLVQGRGAVITGSVWRGSVHDGDEIAWLPSGQPVRVRGVQTHNRSVESASRGQRAAINLIGAHHQDIQRGHEIATPGYLKPHRTLTARLQVLPQSPWPIKHRQRLRLYLGAQEIMAVTALLDDDVIEPGQSGLVQFHCVQPATATNGQPFVIRSESPLVTIGGGRILQPIARRLTKKHPHDLKRLLLLDDPDDMKRAEAAIYFYAARDWTMLDLCRDANIEPSRAEALTAQFLKQKIVSAWAMSHQRTAHLHREVVEQLAGRIENTVEKMHQQAPLAANFAREQLTDRLRRLCEPMLLEKLIDHLIEQGKLIGGARTAALAGKAPKLTKAQQALLAQIKKHYQQANAAPPTLAELSKQFNAAEAALRPILELSVVEGELVHLDSGMYLHVEAEQALRKKLTEALSENDGLTTSEIRQQLNSTRKYVIPICEHFDRTGLTRRVGDKRVLVDAATCR